MKVWASMPLQGHPLIGRNQPHVLHWRKATRHDMGRLFLTKFVAAYKHMDGIERMPPGRHIHSNRAKLDDDES